MHMSRRQEQSIADDIFEALKIAPIWLGPLLSTFVFVFVRFVVPALLPSKQGGIDVGALWRPIFAGLSWICAAGCLFLWAMAELWKLSNRRLLDKQTSLASIRDIPWQEFERLVSEAYRRKGYMAEVVGNASGDGGVDVRLTGHGETVLVQCKQWKAYRVGVTTVRELLGVVVSHSADRGLVVTSGRFTQEAKAFARQNPRIELVDGTQLDELIRSMRSASVKPPRPPVPAPMTAAAAPDCPLCGTPMVPRKGRNAGSEFWGCQTYPACRGIRQK